MNKNYDDVNFWNKEKKKIGSDVIVTPRVIELLRELDLKNKRVLDLGCGDGSITNYLKEQGAEIIGVDINEKLINEAKKKYGDFFEVHDISKKFPFDDESFDVVFSSLTFLHLKTQGLKRAYSEINRVLKNEGIFVLANIHPYSILFRGESKYVKYISENTNYYSRKERKAELMDLDLKESIVLDYYNHEMQMLLNLAFENNLELLRFFEPRASKEDVKRYSGMDYERRFPSYVIFVFRKKFSNYELTLKKIESMEKTWRYYLSEEESKKHSYGRVPEDGNEVAFWSVPKSTAEFLYHMTKLINPKIVLELGCSVGYSTLHIAKALENKEGVVYTTEILKEKIKLAKRNFKEAGLQHKINLVERDILDVLKNWDKSKKIDFVFMDADKERYMMYFELMLPLLSKGGLIIVDNAGKVRMADGRLIENEHIEEFKRVVLKDKRVFAKYYDMDNGLLLIYKK